MSEDDMKISRLIEILQKHGDIRVSQNERTHFEGIQIKAFVNTESNEFEEPELII